jgi:CheY-like chemotaxis protein/CRP-like cAMP-binding protein
MVDTPSERMVQVVSEQPLFKGLSQEQVRALLNLAEHRFVDAGRDLYQAQESVGEVSILFAGNLSKVDLNGEIAGAVTPVALIGFHELLTGRVFADRLRAEQTCHLASLTRSSLEALLATDLEFQTALLRNLSGLLSREIDHEASKQLEERESNERRFAELRAELDQITETVKNLVEHLPSTAIDGLGTLAAHGESPPAQALTRETPVCVLVVDDEPDLRAYVKRVLSSCIVLEANSGDEAMEVIHNTRPDLIIADIRMSGMDGCTLLTNVRNMFPNLPVLATSGFLDMEDLQGYDFDGFIDKPIKADTLRTVVAEYFQQS